MLALNESQIVFLFLSLGFLEIAIHRYTYTYAHIYKHIYIHIPQVFIYNISCNVSNMFFFCDIFHLFLVMSPKENFMKTVNEMKT